MRCRSMPAVVAAMLALAATPAFAQSFFGNTIILTSATPTCPGDGTQDSGVLASAPLDVEVESRLMAIVTVSTGEQSAIVYAAVTNPSGSQTLGTTSSGSQAWALGQDQTVRPPITAQGVMHQGRTPIAPTAPILTLAPGSYNVQLRVVSGFCGSGFGFSSATLSYILLSATSDRLFANGFA
jgi:hypothetical protein